MITITFEARSSAGRQRPSLLAQVRIWYLSILVEGGELSDEVGHICPVFPKVGEISACYVGRDMELARVQISHTLRLLSLAVHLVWTTSKE